MASRLLNIAALLAWTTLQMPLLVCDYSCGASTAIALPLAGGHGVHGMTDDHHHHDGCDRHALHEGSHPDHDDSHQHVVVQLESSPAGVPLALPVPRVLAVLMPDASERIVLASLLSRAIAPDEEPPRWTADPESAFARLLV